MLQLLKNFFNSEKGVFGYLVPLVLATVFVFTSKITPQEWMDFALFMSGIYVTGKTVQGSAAVLANGQASKNAVEAEMAKAGIDVLKHALTKNDSAADEALEEKFKED